MIPKIHSCVHPTYIRQYMHAHMDTYKHYIHAYIIHTHAHMHTSKRTRNTNQPRQARFYRASCSGRSAEEAQQTPPRSGRRKSEVRPRGPRPKARPRQHRGQVNTGTAARTLSKKQSCSTHITSHVPFYLCKQLGKKMKSAPPNDTNY